VQRTRPSFRSTSLAAPGLTTAGELKATGLARTFERERCRVTPVLAYDENTRNHVAQTANGRQHSRRAKPVPRVPQAAASLCRGPSYALTGAQISTVRPPYSPMLPALARRTKALLSGMRVAKGLLPHGCPATFTGTLLPFVREPLPIGPAGPQQYAIPFVVRPQECNPPALSAANESPPITARGLRLHGCEKLVPLRH
jgi:hypothetical protein